MHDHLLSLWDVDPFEVQHRSIWNLQSLTLNAWSSSIKDHVSISDRTNKKDSSIPKRLVFGLFVRNDTIAYQVWHLANREGDKVYHGDTKNSLLVYLHTLDSNAYSHLPVLLHVLPHLYPARFVEHEQYWRTQWVFLDQSTPLNPISFHSGYFSSRDTYQNIACHIP